MGGSQLSCQGLALPCHAGHCRQGVHIEPSLSRRLYTRISAAGADPCCWALCLLSSRQDILGWHVCKLLQLLSRAALPPGPSTGARTQFGTNSCYPGAPIQQDHTSAKQIFGSDRPEVTHVAHTPLGVWKICVISSLVVSFLWHAAHCCF